MASSFFKALTRRKITDDKEESQLARCLTLLDLTALGVGGTLGLGVYVLAGSVAKTTAGPAVCLSFAVAAIASAVAGLCYAEFAARVPKAGSAYVYSYVSVGEFIAFIIGWNLILEYVIGTASVARGLSNYIDALANYEIRNSSIEAMPINVSFLSEYPDFLSLGLVLVLTALLSSGVKESTMLNNIFTVLNLLTVSIVIVAGAIKAKPENWNISEEEAQSHDGGTGGFMPFGVAGVMAGAARCFYGFVGFDAVATTGEEAKNPQRDIPLAIVVSLIVIFGAYFGVATVLTMMWPYYDQDVDAPFPHVFEQIGWIAIKWIVTIGAIFALSTSLLGAMFPLPRILYAMANDGLIFKWLANIHKKTQTPILATVLSGILAGLMGMLFNLEQLIDMMSIGTLLAYTIVAVCVLILRYQPDENQEVPNLEIKKTQSQSYYFILKQIFNLNNNKFPNSLTTRITNWTIGIYSIFVAAFCAMVINGLDYIADKNPSFITGFVIVTVLMLSCIVIIARQPVQNRKLSFKVPWVPVIPCLSVIFNLYLMLELDSQTWIRFGVWLVLGFLIYFFYGIKNSAQKDSNIKLKQIERAEKEQEANKKSETKM